MRRSTVWRSRQSKLRRVKVCSVVARRSRRGAVRYGSVGRGWVRRSRFVSVWSNLVEHGEAVLVSRGMFRLVTVKCVMAWQLNINK